MKDVTELVNASAKNFRTYGSFRKLCRSISVHLAAFPITRYTLRRAMMPGVCGEACHVLLRHKRGA